MKIGKLLNGVNCKKINVNEEINIDYLCLNDKKCRRECAFFCIKGNNENGENYAINAVKNGANLIIAERELSNIDVGQIVVKDVRKAMLKMSMNLYDNPQKKLRTIGIVGTNGKTTICTLIAEILNKNSLNCGKIGTFGATYNNIEISTGFTTPDTPDIFKIMNDMVNEGVKILCMEVSAHAIYYKKADFPYDILVFTNCTQDHLDFFGSFEEYKAVKQSVFMDENARIAVVNSDDKAGLEIAIAREKGVITYGMENPSDVFAIDICEGKNGINFVINLFDRVYSIKSNLYGKFNVYNLMAVAIVCAVCGIKTEIIARELCNIKQVEGRMEKVAEKINIFVDYAHTPDGLKQALLSLDKIKDDKKLICVFGCGGNRDEKKRQIMGEISGQYADFTIITSDNPRFEDEENIIAQIEQGIRRKTLDYITISDRKSAIEYAIQCANAGDYILIAGKGAEKYQESMGAFSKFSDKETAVTLMLNKYDTL